MIDGKLLCSTCMFAPPERGIEWPKGLRAIEDLPMPVRLVSREELEREYPGDSDTR
jgi:hypothetical protein